MSRPRRAGRVSEHEREKAARQQADTDYAARLGRSAAILVGRRGRAGVLAAFRAGRNVNDAIAAMFAELQDPVVQGMVYARLRGLDRAMKTLGRSVTTISAAQTPALRRGIKFLRKRLELEEAEIAAIETTASAHVVRVLATAELAVQKELQATIVKITAEGLHTRPAVKELRKKWKALGLSEKSSFQLEAIVRTQTQLAYAAGNADAYADPDIDEILWGFKYVTVGDDRVRDTHIALDGVTLPKDDPFWQTNTPPNGWACRCTIIAIFAPRNEVQAPSTIEVDGKTVVPGADEGFQSSPRDLLGG
jgi:SPP1 gp7 family putative phage head morphogenesis protein